MDHENYKYFWILLYLSLSVIVLTTTFSISGFSFFDQKKIVQASVLLVSSISFVFLFYKHRITGFSKKIWLGSVVVIFFWTVSSILSPLPVWAFLQVGWYILILQLLLLCAFLYQKDRDRFINLVLIGLILLCVVYSLRVYTDYITGLFNENWTTWPTQNKIEYRKNGVLLNPSAYLGFDHVRFFNHIQTWTLPLLAFAYLYFKDKLIPGLRYLLLFFISSWWMLVFAADARGTTLASLVSFLFVIFLFKKQSIEFAKIYLTTALVGLLLYLFLFLLPKSDAQEILTRFGSSGRIEVWLFTVDQIWENPFLGLGPMHFSYMGINPPWSTPHNFILQSAVEWGVPALLLFISLVGVGFFRFVKQSIELVEEQQNKSFKWLRMALIASFSAALVHSMFSGIFNSSLSQLLFAIIGGWIIGDYFLKAGKQLFVERTKKNLTLILALLLLGINSVFVGYSVYSEASHLEERKQEFFTRYGDYTLYPRFWHQGMIYEDSVNVDD